jgi:cobalt-zinc-cadmium efflux system protein
MSQKNVENRHVLGIVFALTTIYLIVEIVVGLATNSLALFADAVHMFTDAGALALAVFAAWITNKPAPPEKTYGYYRAEILAALANALLLVFSSAYILYEAYQRFMEPVQIMGWPLMITAVVGLGVNLIAVWLMHARVGENLNMQGAFYEVIKDTLGSVGVIISGIVVLITDFYRIDALISFLIALMILPRTWTLIKNAVNILLESTPAHLNLDEIKAAITRLDYIRSVHDLHVWTISSGRVSLSGHIVIEPDTNLEAIMTLPEHLRHYLETGFDIDHTTIQIEFPESERLEPAW